MSSSSEQLPTVRRIDRRYLVFNWVTSVSLTILGAAALTVAVMDPDWIIHHATPFGRSRGDFYAIATAIAGLVYGIITLTKLLKAKPRKSSGGRKP